MDHQSIIHDMMVLKVLPPFIIYCFVVDCAYDVLQIRGSRKLRPQGQAPIKFTKDSLIVSADKPAFLLPE